jgi:hypothetical protein
LVAFLVALGAVAFLVRFADFADAVTGVEAKAGAGDADALKDMFVVGGGGGCGGKDEFGLRPFYSDT